jgi:Uncharacterized distant relative of homeotic protein bithoraxoid
MDSLLGAKLQEIRTQKALDDICRSMKAIQLVVLASVDGFNLAASGKMIDEDPELSEKFAAMSSSMAALGNAVGAELKSSEPFSVVIADYKELQVVLRTVNVRSGSFVLAAAASKSVVLGNLLLEIRDCTQKIRDVLR